MVKSNAVILASTAFCLGALTGCWEGISRDVLATVLSVHGDSTVRFGQHGKFQSVNADSTFPAGSHIETAAGAVLDLILLPGLFVRVFDNSKLDIENLTLVKDGNETGGGMSSRAARVRLLQGRVVASFEDSRGARGELVLTTDRITITANPASLLRVESGERETRVVSAWRTIYTAPADSGDPGVPQGYYQVWPSDVRRAIPTADDARAQADLAETVAVGNELRDLREANLPRANQLPR